MIKVSKKILNNKLTVLTIPQDTTDTVTVMVLVPVGSRHEVPHNNGISHFLEHLMFKGTERRPSTLELTKQLDAVGAEYNAFTSKDTTIYYIKVAASQLELALDLFSDMLFHSLFDPAEIDRERGVILEELNMYEDNPLMHVDTLFEMSVFNKTHPLGYDIGGKKDNIRKLPRQAFIDYKKTHYSPAAMHLVIAGNIDKRVSRWVKQYFGDQPAGQGKPSYKHFQPYQKNIQFNHKYKDTKQTQLALGVLAPGLREDKQLATLSVLSTILGGNMSSRLFISIRERQGLCYVIHSDISPYVDSSALMVQAGVDNERVYPAIIAIVEELAKLKTDLVTTEELINAKNCMAGQTAIKLESSSALAGYYGKQSVLLGTLLPPQKKLALINTVTKADIRRLARHLLNFKQLNIASIGPQRQLASVAKKLTC
ncbi:MAG: pitrilysin family protein [Patescibacteria group bacterium]|jgi:predicted Zn-dependent peptidase